MGAWRPRLSLSVSNHLLKEVPWNLLRAATATLIATVLLGCTPPQPKLEEIADDFLTTWFSEPPKDDDNRCHGLGTLKHNEFTCLDMQQFAARVDPARRTLVAQRAHDCFARVCGDFAEVEFDSHDHAGNPVRETAIVKRDDGTVRLYWYRSDLMLAAYKAANPEPEEEKEPIQVAYDEITARYPALYQYPPCYGVRASSSTLVAELMVRDAIDVEAVEQLAENCGETFCFSLVGEKIAPLCPDAI